MKVKNLIEVFIAAVMLMLISKVLENTFDVRIWEVMFVVGMGAGLIAGATILVRIIKYFMP